MTGLTLPPILFTPEFWRDPLVLAACGGVLLAAFLLARRAGRRSAEARAMGARLAALDDGQRELAGGLRAVAEAQAAAQARLGESLERRFEDVQRRLGDTLHGAANRTARSLGALETRLTAIDAAQAKIEKLSGEVLGLQQILSNKQARGAFGEIQLADILSAALPPDAYALQATLSNGRRVDCLIRLPAPPGVVPVDAKFPLESYQALVNAEDDRARAQASAAFRTDIRRHVDAIADRYVAAEETGEGALMFLPSEAVYAELHARHGEVVRRAFGKGVYIVSPTTLMATLTTMRAILKDARLRDQAGAMRRELALLHADLGRLADRVGALDRHFEQARRDVEQITVSAEKASARAARLEAVEFDAAPRAAE